MDPRLRAVPTPEQLDRALAAWPELGGHALVALLVTAFGDIFVEVDEGEVWLVSPGHAAVGRVAASRQELAQLFRDPDWSERRLGIYEILRLDSEHRSRPIDQVWAHDPHPAQGGGHDGGEYRLMDLDASHARAAALRRTR